MNAKRTLVRRAAMLALVAGGTLSAGAASAADLTVVVTNLKKSGGTLRIGIFKDPATFPKADQILVGKMAPGAPGEITFVFNDLPPGEYAVSAFHDLDDNGKLNRNLFGVPSEPYGFSRDARGSSGPPTFAEAKVALAASGTRITFAVK